MFTRKMGAVAATIAATVFGTSMLFTPQGTELEGRVKSLEDRVAKLEAAQPVSAPAPLAESKVVKAGEYIVPMSVTNKRFQAANARARVYQDAIWWDCKYDFSTLKKDARAIKGVVEFRDLFGDAKFQVNVTINDPVKACGEHTSEGVGVHFNQFLESHRWMQSTDLKDMMAVFRVHQVIYADNTREEFK